MTSNRECYSDEKLSNINVGQLSAIMEFNENVLLMVLTMSTLNTGGNQQYNV